MPFWPQHLADPVFDPPRVDWNDWGPAEQERRLRDGLGNKLFDYLEEKSDDRGRTADDGDQSGR